MSLAQIYNFFPLSDFVATGGQPTAEQLGEIAQSGYQVVINLALTNSSNAIAREREIVEAQGMHYIHIPVVWEQPVPEDFQRFCDAMAANATQKVFVHCAANKRVSAFVYLYRRLHQQVKAEVALRDLHRIWQPNETWQHFIDEILESSLL